MLVRAFGFAEPSEVSERSIDVPKCSAPAAKIVFTGLGTGMTEMLATALTQTGCFAVQERAELDEINKEPALVGRKVEAEVADYMIIGSITSLGL